MEDWQDDDAAEPRIRWHVQAKRPSLDDLEEALEWVGMTDMGNRARVSLRTGAIHLLSEHGDDIDEPPDDVDDDELYVEVPEPRDLDLGRDLVMRFARQQMPSALEDVTAMFSRRGAYRRFDVLLERAGRRQDWLAFRRAATRDALADWARAEGIPL